MAAFRFNYLLRVKFPESNPVQSRPNLSDYTGMKNVWIELELKFSSPNIFEQDLDSPLWSPISPIQQKKKF